jgi:hypothetical protein
MKYTDAQMRDSLDRIGTDYCLDQLKFDLITMLMGTGGSSDFLLHEDGKLRPPFKVIDCKTPWIFVRPRDEFQCQIWHNILFDRLKIFPPKCLECYKVVVKPRNFKETMMLLELQTYYTERYCKVGFEERQYTFGSWGGYFYCKGVDEGQEVYAEVREMIDKFISPDVPVILKRACTEFEHKFGPSDQWAVTEESRIWAQLVDAWVEHPKFKGQPGILKTAVLARWATEAYKMGDETVLEFNLGDEDAIKRGGHIYKPLVTYHEEGQNG